MSFDSSSESNDHQKYQPSENNMFYAKAPISGMGSNEGYISPFANTDDSLDPGVSEGPSVAAAKSPPPNNTSALSRVQHPRPTYPEEIDPELFRSGFSHTSSPHGNPVAIDQRARPPPHKIRNNPLVKHPSDGCRMCGKKIVSQCGCASHETVCEGGHCYFIDPRTGQAYGKSFPQTERPPSRRGRGSYTDNYGNSLSQIS